jgi:hypothetical protein
VPEDVSLAVSRAGVGSPFSTALLRYRAAAVQGDLREMNNAVESLPGRFPDLKSTDRFSDRLLRLSERRSEWVRATVVALMREIPIVEMKEVGGAARRVSDARGSLLGDECEPGRGLYLVCSAASTEERAQASAILRKLEGTYPWMREETDALLARMSKVLAGHALADVVALLESGRDDDSLALHATVTGDLAAGRAADAEVAVGLFGQWMRSVLEDDHAFGSRVHWSAVERRQREWWARRPRPDERWDASPLDDGYRDAFRRLDVLAARRKQEYLRWCRSKFESVDLPGSEVTQHLPDAAALRPPIAIWDAAGRTVHDATYALREELRARRGADSLTLVVVTGQTTSTAMYKAVLGGGAFGPPVPRSRRHDHVVTLQFPGGRLQGKAVVNGALPELIHDTRLPAPDLREWVEATAVR